MTREEVTLRIRAIVREHFEKTTGTGLVDDNLRLDTNLGQDLAFDSLDNIELVMALEDAFDIEIPDAEVEGFVTLGNVADYVAKTLQVAA